MSLPPVELEQTSVVVLGAFNPAIFSVAWLLSQGLISESQAKSASVDVITPDVALFHLGLIDFDVQRQRLQVSTSDIDETERVRDLVIGLLRLLPHTPIGALGVNRAVHVQVADFVEYHRFGDALVPKGFWHSFMRAPGMINTTVRGLRPDDHVGYVQLSVEPSALIRPGLFLHHNDHYALRRDRLLTGREDPGFQAQDLSIELNTENLDVALDVLANDWGRALTRAHDAFEKVWAFGQSRSDS